MVVSSVCGRVEKRRTVRQPTSKRYDTFNFIVPLQMIVVLQ